MGFHRIFKVICELFGCNEFLDKLPLLKAPQNLLAADRIWKNICRDCKYEFIATDPGQFVSYQK